MTKEFKLSLPDQTVRINCDENLSAQAEWLLQVIRRIYDEKGTLQDGETIQLGWSVLTLIQNQNELIVCEPDFDKNPFEDLSPDITTTLLITTQQNELLKKIAIEGEPALYFEKLVYQSGSLSFPKIYLERVETDETGDSGWYLGKAEEEDKDAEKNYEAMFIYQLLEAQPELLQVLNLPKGFLAVFEDGEIAAILDKEENNLWQTAE